ncbi:RICIN domain-containing protein [Symbioplanes lichenis]|uniref:RICIN domain-containing protein n=1 Tax=Symbioplanes lichenis TaxID=1629072 RepID=UPI002739A58F|nr:RICIN domain-containing protein [Actinoplanes lichenis]
MLAWILLSLGVLLVIACVVVAVWFKRRAPEPTKSPAQLWTETDRYYYAEDLPEHGVTPEADRRPLLVLGGMAVLAVVALAAGGTLMLRTDQDQPLASSTPTASPPPIGSRITAGESGLCLAAEYAGDGAPVSLRTCQATETQQWQPVDDGTIRIGTRCMDVAGAETKIGTIIQLAECNGNAAQLFRFENGKLISGLNGNCVDARSGKVAPGVGAVIQRCAAVGARTWQQLS